MTHYYLYIQAGLEVDSQTHFYKVAIGESAKGLKMCSWLEAYAVEHGHLFVRWSLESAEFLFRCQESIGPDAQPIVAIPGHDLIQSLKNGCEDPACWQAIQHRHHLLMQIDPHYYTYYQIARR